MVSRKGTKRTQRRKEIQILLCAFASSLRLCVKLNLLLAGCRCLRVVTPARIALANACRLTAQSAQVVKLRPSDTSTLHEIDVIDDRSVQRKDSLDADAETRLAH